MHSTSTPIKMHEIILSTKETAKVYFIWKQYYHVNDKLYS